MVVTSVTCLPMFALIFRGWSEVRSMANLWIGCCCHSGLGWKLNREVGTPLNALQSNNSIRGVVQKCDRLCIVFLCLVFFSECFLSLHSHMRRMDHIHVILRRKARAMPATNAVRSVDLRQGISTWEAGITAASLERLESSFPRKDWIRVRGRNKQGKCHLHRQAYCVSLCSIFFLTFLHGGLRRSSSVMQLGAKPLRLSSLGLAPAQAKYWFALLPRKLSRILLY